MGLTEAAAGVVVGRDGSGDESLTPTVLHCDEDIAPCHTALLVYTTQCSYDLRPAPQRLLGGVMGEGRLSTTGGSPVTSLLCLK